MAYTNEAAVGQVTEVTGEATVIRADGTEEVITLGTKIFLGDVVETVGDGAVNIGFTDDSSFAISDNASVTIDEYVYDPATESGDQDFSVARGVFMYTSGLIGRESPDSVEIDTPVGSIGIRGTVIGGKIVEEGQGESQITVLEGAIVVRNAAGEQILSNQFDTVKLASAVVAPSAVEQMDASRVANDYGAVKNVSASLFTSLEDQMQAEEGVSEGLDESSVDDSEAEAEAEVQDGDTVEAGEAAAEGEGDAEAQADGEAEAESEFEADDAAEDGETNLMDDMKAEADAQAESLTQQMNASLQQQASMAETTSVTSSTQTTNTSGSSNATSPSSGSTDGAATDVTTTNDVDLNDPTLDPTPDTSPDPTPNPAPTLDTLFLEVRPANMYSPYDGVEGLIPINQYGAKIVDLDIRGTLQGSVSDTDFSITGDYANYLEVRAESGGFALFLNSSTEVKDFGAPLYNFFDGILGSSGLPFTKDTLFNLADISVSVPSPDGPVTASTNIEAVTSDVTPMAGIIAANEDIIVGDTADNNLGFKQNHDFKLIDGGEGIDKINLDSTSTTMFNFTNDGSRSNLGASNSQDLRSIENIMFSNSIDTLTIDIDNILRLLKTSDDTDNLSIVGSAERILRIDTVTDNFTGTAAPANNFNVVKYDDSNNQLNTRLENEGFTRLTDGTFFVDSGTRYEVYQHDLGVVMIESQIRGAETGGL